MKKFDKALNLILPTITFLCLLVIWGVASLVIKDEYILPSISQTFSRLLALAKDGNFYRALFSTLFRSLIGFVVSFVLASVFATLTIKIKYAERIISPIIRVIRALPTIAVVLLLLFWTNSKIAPIVVTVLVVLPTTYTHLTSAFFGLDKMVSEAGRVDGANEYKVLINIEIPQMLPSIYNAIGSGISLNFKLMVAAEVISQTANSLGFLLNTSKVYFEIATMLAIVLVAVTLGVIVEWIFNRLSAKASDWK